MPSVQILCSFIHTLQCNPTFSSIVQFGTLLWNYFVDSAKEGSPIISAHYFERTSHIHHRLDSIFYQIGVKEICLLMVPSVLSILFHLFFCNCMFLVMLKILLLRGLSNVNYPFNLPFQYESLCVMPSFSKVLSSLKWF